MSVIDAVDGSHHRQRNVRYWLLADIQNHDTGVQKTPLKPDDGNCYKCDECNSPILLTFNYDFHLALPDF
jgi:hypothetical protein